MVKEFGLTDSKLLTTRLLPIFYVAITALNGNASFSRKKIPEQNTAVMILG